MNPRYQQELFQQFERHLPGGWFRLLANKQGPLFPVAWALCGAMAGLQESLESAQEMAIPATSSGFWLSLHLLGLGLRRRPEETDPQAYQRYQFEFLPTRNTREGLLTVVGAHSGLPESAVALETNFAEGRYGELLLRVETEDPWQDFDWWWVEAFFAQWVANGLSRRVNLQTAGLRTLALPPFTHQHRFPTGQDMLAPFWERPAFVNELRLIESEQLFVSPATIGATVWVEPATVAALPTATAWAFMAITPLPKVASGLSTTDTSQNLLATIAGAAWNDEVWRLKTLWEGLRQTGQPGQPFFYWTDGQDRPDIEVTYSGFSPPFPDWGLLPTLGRGPWTLTLGTRGSPTSTTVETPAHELPLAGEWWTDLARVRRQANPLGGIDRPVLNNPAFLVPEPANFSIPTATTWAFLSTPTLSALENGILATHLQIEFMLAKALDRRRFTELELGLGYRYPKYEIGPTQWEMPSADLYQLPIAAQLELPLDAEPWQLTPNLPTYATVHYRQMDCTVPQGINAGFLFFLSQG